MELLDELIKKSDAIQQRGDYVAMREYDRQIERIRNSERIVDRKSKLFICPDNDLEAHTIIEILKREGIEVLVTGQAWGASWDNLEEWIKEAIKNAKEQGVEIYGVELQGDFNGAHNVDHHIYGEDDRSNPEASIEQVAKILELELTLDEQFVAANDKGYIPAMENLG